MADQRGLELPEGLRWSDAFPWILASPPSEAAEPWWREPIASDTDAIRRARLEKLCELAMERAFRLSLGHLMPMLASDIALDLLPLPTRARNALARQGLKTSGDLLGVELQSMLTWPSVGVGIVSMILLELADAATRATPPHDDVDAPITTGTEAFAAPLPQPAISESREADLLAVARWNVLTGRLERPIVGDPGIGAPSDITAAAARLSAMTAVDLLPASATAPLPASLFDAALLALDPRSIEVMRDRFFADRPRTLEQVGQQLGVTRERVRQIEVRARASLASLIEADGPLGALAGAIRELIRSVLPLPDLLREIPSLQQEVEAVSQPVWRVIDRLDDSYEIEDQWCVAPTILAAQTATQTMVQELADLHGLVRVEDVTAISNRPSAIETPEIRLRWLTGCGYLVQDGYVQTRLRSIGERAISALAIAGQPLTTIELHERLGVSRSLRSLRNALGGAPSIERVDRDQWALTEWGLDKYTGVRSLIGEELAGRGGRLGLETLIETLTSKYSITASSIAAYASAPPFEVRDGQVQLMSSPGASHKSPERTRRLYRRDGSWLLRIRVTRDHLRGSGFVAPKALATILNLEYGETRELACNEGTQGVNWGGIQPAFGSIRRLLISLDIAIDQEIFLVLADAGTFAIEPVPSLVGKRPLEQALDLVGQGQVSGEPLELLASSICLPIDSPASSIIGGFAERGDGDVAELLLESPDLRDSADPVRTHISAEIDDIMELL